MKILVFGDSHSQYFHITNELRDTFCNSRGINIKVVSISGATIIGFGRRESTLSTYEKLVAVYEDYNPEYVCFALGQVDLELGFYYKKVVKKVNITYEEYLIELKNEYISQIKKIKSNLKINNISLKGVNLSTLTESRNKAINYTSKIILENIKGEKDRALYIDALKLCFSSNIERNSAHLKFNSLLKDACNEEGYGYFDIINEIIEPFSKNIKKEFLPAANDHHLVDSLYIREKHIQNLIRSFYNK